MALDYAAAVNEEIKDLFAAGADVVQIDEPWMQQHPDKAREYGLKALDRALEGVSGAVCCAFVLRLCRRRARQAAPVIHFCPELEGSKAAQISIEAAQPQT